MGLTRNLGVDEEHPTFNWGYDPQNFNVPEGSYSTNPNNPVTRIVELKTAVQARHGDKLRVMMDIVYNHVYSAPDFSEEKIVPEYFFRTNADSTLSNGSGVGNDVASERPMVRKFIRANQQNIGSLTGIAGLNRFSASIAILAQEVPFMQAGQEFLRSKNGDSNSYKSGNSIAGTKSIKTLKMANRTSVAGQSTPVLEK